MRFREAESRRANHFVAMEKGGDRARLKVASARLLAGGFRYIAVCFERPPWSIRIKAPLRSFGPLRYYAELLNAPALCAYAPQLIDDFDAARGGSNIFIHEAATNPVLNRHDDASIGG